MILLTLELDENLINKHDIKRIQNVLKIPFIKLIKVSRVFVSPKGNTRNSESPCLILRVELIHNKVYFQLMIM